MTVSIIEEQLVFRKVKGTRHTGGSPRSQKGYLVVRVLGLPLLWSEATVCCPQPPQRTPGRRNWTPPSSLELLATGAGHGGESHVGFVPSGMVEGPWVGGMLGPSPCPSWFMPILLSTPGANLRGLHQQAPLASSFREGQPLRVTGGTPEIGGRPGHLLPADPLQYCCGLTVSLVQRTQCLSRWPSLHTPSSSGLVAFPAPHPFRPGCHALLAVPYTPLTSLLAVLLLSCPQISQLECVIPSLPGPQVDTGPSVEVDKYPTLDSCSGNAKNRAEWMPAGGGP